MTLLSPAPTDLLGYDNHTASTDGSFLANLLGCMARHGESLVVYDAQWRFVFEAIGSPDDDDNGGRAA